MHLSFITVTKHNIDKYLTTGITAYKEHYLHLWKNNNPSPFIHSFLTKESVTQSLADSSQLFYIIKFKGNIAGILNLTLDSKKGAFLSKENLLLNKIYLLKKYAVQGIGSKTIKFVEQLAEKNKKDVVWLYAMKKGKPLDFYKKHNYKIVKESCIDLPNVLDAEKEMWLMAKNL
jgi:GNAT superfamily N-acetyltransferase